MKLDDLLRRAAESLSPALAGDAILRELDAARASLSYDSARNLGGGWLRLGLLTPAESLFDGLVQFDPSRPAGFVGLAEVASARKLWPLALRRWDAVLSKFPDRAAPHGFAARARAWNELGRTEEALAELEELAKRREAEPFVSLFHAQAAMSRRDWREALERWRQIRAQFSGAIPFGTTEVAMANTLLALRQADEAETLCRDVLKRDPAHVAALHAVMRSLSQLRRHHEALAAFAESPYHDASIPPLLGVRLETLMLMHDFEAARALFHEHLRVAAGVESIEILFAYNPRLQEGWRRTEAWIAMSARLSTFARPSDKEAAAAVDALHGRIRLALRDRPGFARLARDATADGELRIGGLGLREVAATIADPAFPSASKSKVFGIGLPKTATTTLATCLNHLGIATLHFTNPLTCELLCDDDLFLFDGFTDLPVCQSFESYYFRFPHSKFIYTTRAFAAWEASLIEHWTHHQSKASLNGLIDDLSSKKEFRYGARYAEFFGSFVGHGSLATAFQGYDRRVRHFFSDKPRDRFLEWDISAGEGWPKLCAFLGVGIPPLDFPAENRDPRRIRGEEQLVSG